MQPIAFEKKLVMPIYAESKNTPDVCDECPSGECYVVTNAFGECL